MTEHGKLSPESCRSGLARGAIGAWGQIRRAFVNVLRETGGRIEELSLADLTVKLRAGIDAGNWQQRGDAILAALAASNRPVVLAIDELPILINRLLKDDDGRITPEGKRLADTFLSWLRRNGQAYRGQITMIVSGSVGLEPVLDQARLSAHGNIYSPYDLKPWDEETAAACLEALARSYGLRLAPEVRREMCSRLRCCIPHHVQMCFDKLHDHLRRGARVDASLDDAEWVYRHEMLSVRGQADLRHYENRLATVLGAAGYPIALELLTEAATKGRLDNETRDRYHAYFAAQGATGEDGVPPVEAVLRVLLHDGYLERHDGSYRFVSGLLEDWWRGRHARNFVSVVDPDPRGRGAGRRP